MRLLKRIRRDRAKPGIADYPWGIYQCGYRRPDPDYTPRSDITFEGKRSDRTNHDKQDEEHPSAGGDSTFDRMVREYDLVRILPWLLWR